jgi:hypothetical protein
MDLFSDKLSHGFESPFETHNYRNNQPIHNNSNGYLQGRRNTIIVNQISHTTHQHHQGGLRPLKPKRDILPFSEGCRPERFSTSSGLQS